MPYPEPHRRRTSGMAPSAYLCKVRPTRMVIPESEADWRFATVAKVKGDHYLEGQLVKDGTLLWLTTVTPSTGHGMVSFPTPHPAALAFSLAFDAARAAAAMRSRLTFDGGRGKVSVSSDSVPALFAYFEQAMAAAVFSFQCIEVHANQAIATLAKQAIDVPRRRGVERLEPEELERHLSTDEKVTLVLPGLTSAKSLKKTQYWASYRALKEVRDSTVHLKSANQYVRNKVDKSSVYHRLLNHAPLTFPSTAINVVRHFSAPGPERWVEAAAERLIRIKTR